MIENDKQLKLTEEWIGTLQNSFEEMEKNPDLRLDPVILQAQKDGVLSQIEGMKQDVAAYKRSLS